MKTHKGVVTLGHGISLKSLLLLSKWCHSFWGLVCGRPTAENLTVGISFFFFI